MAQNKQKPKKTFINSRGDRLKYYRDAPQMPPPSFLFPQEPRPQPYMDMLNQAAGPPDINSPWAPPYPQPQRPDAYSNMHAGRDGRQFAEEMMGDQPIQQPGPYASGYQTDPMQPQDVQPWGEPPMHPDQAAPFNEAWQRNLDKSSKEFADNTWGMMKRGAGKIGDFFQGAWDKAANRGPDVNLTEDLIGKGIPAAASAVYNTGKGIWDQATDPSNMRGPFQKKVIEHYARPGGELRDVTQEGLKGTEMSPPQMPNLEEASMSSDHMSDKMFQDWQDFSGGKGWYNPTTGMGKGDADTIAARDESNPDWRMDTARQQGWAKNYLDQQAQPEAVSPMDALGAKIAMGAKGMAKGVGGAIEGIGDAITGAPRGAAELAGKGLGGMFNYGGSMVDAFKKGWMGEQSPQAQGTPQAGKREIDVSPLQGMNDPRLEKGAKVSPSQNIASTKGGFKGAFAAARKSGKKEFTYKGKKYNTRLKGQKAGAKKKPNNPYELVKQMRENYGDLTSGQSPFLKKMPTKKNSTVGKALGSGGYYW